MNISTRYRAAHTSGARSTKDIRYIVLHATEGATAAGAASWFTNASSGGSAHVVVDGLNTAYRCVPDDVIPWGAPPLNGSGLHIEQAGFTAWPYSEWLRHEKTIEHCAEIVAGWCKKYGIRAAYLSDEELRAGHLGGIVTHRQVSRVFRQSDHTDPGAGYPHVLLLKKVHARLHPARPSTLRRIANRLGGGAGRERVA